MNVHDGFFITIIRINLQNRKKKIPNSLLTILKSNVLTKTKHRQDHYIKSLKGYSNSFKIHSVIRILHAEGRPVAQPLPQPAPQFAVAQKCRDSAPESACNTAE